MPQLAQVLPAVLRHLQELLPPPQQQLQLRLQGNLQMVWVLLQQLAALCAAAVMLVLAGLLLG